MFKVAHYILLIEGPTDAIFKKSNNGILSKS